MAITVSVYNFFGGTTNAPLTANVVVVKNSAASYLGCRIQNLNASNVYVQTFNANNVANVTLGTTAPIDIIPIPSGGFWQDTLIQDNKIVYPNGIAVAATTTPTGNVAPSSNVIGNINYL